MSLVLDGNFTTAFQPDGARIMSLPLQGDQEYFATWTEWNYLATAAYYNPLLSQRTAYTNLLTWSDDFTNAAWTKTNLTVGTGGTDPEGNATLCKLQENTTNGAHQASQAITVSAGPLSFGVMTLPGERTILRLRIHNATDGDIGLAIFDLGAGTVTATAGTAIIKKLLNGFWWCALSATPTVANSTLFADLGQNATTFSYAGTTGSGLSIWHATVITGLVPGPAIMTAGATQSVTCPAVDQNDPISFLAIENAPDPGLLNVGVAKWSRTYSRIPKETNVPGSIIVSKPDIPKTGILLTPYLENGSAAWIVGQPFVGACYLLTLSGVLTFNRNVNFPTWDLYRVAAVTGDTGPTPALAPDGGTYTLTFNASTTANINYNDVAATVSTRLNALANVTQLGGVLVTGSYTAGFTITFNAIPLFTIDTSSLTGSFTSRVYGSFGNSFAAVQVGSGVTGGTYTLTIFGQTTAAIAWNAAPATIQAAINALSHVTTAGGVTILGTPQFLPGWVAFNIRMNLAAITGSTAAIQPPGSVVFAQLVNGPYYGYNQIVTVYAAVARVLVVPSHGFQSSDSLCLLGTTTPLTSQVPSLAYFDVTTFTVVDVNTIQLNVTGQEFFASTPLMLYVGAKRVTNYQSGPINARCRVVTDYYLPGVSPGITSGDDVPLATVQSDPQQFLGGMVAAPTLNYEVGDLKNWTGPILSATKRTVRVADLGVTTFNL